MLFASIKGRKVQLNRSKSLVGYPATFVNEDFSSSSSIEDEKINPKLHTHFSLHGKRLQQSKTACMDVSVGQIFRPR